MKLSRHLWVALFLLFPQGGFAAVYLTVPEALRKAFPNPAVTRTERAYLTEEQMEEARRLAGSDTPIESALVTYFVATVGPKVVGTAYLDTHVVRTLAETVMIVVAPDGSIAQIEILSFLEPREYFPPQGWLGQLAKRKLAPELSLKREIQNITGASMTARALTRSVRRILVLHSVIHKSERS